MASIKLCWTCAACYPVHASEGTHELGSHVYHITVKQAPCLLKATVSARGACRMCKTKTAWFCVGCLPDGREKECLVGALQLPTREEPPAGAQEALDFVGGLLSGKAVGPLGENNSLERSLYKGSE